MKQTYAKTSCLSKCVDDILWPKFLFAFVALAFFGLFTDNSARAQTTWTNTAGGTWSTSGDWSSGVPSAATIANFGTGDNSYTITLDASSDLAKGITSSVGDGVTIAMGGDGLALGASGVAVSGSSSTGAFNTVTFDGQNTSGSNLSIASTATIGVNEVSAGGTSEPAEGLTLQNGVNMTAASGTYNVYIGSAAAAGAGGSNGTMTVASGSTVSGVSSTVIGGIGTSASDTSSNNSLIVTGSKTSYTTTNTQIGTSGAGTGTNNSILVENGATYTNTAAVLNYTTGSSANGNTFEVESGGTANIASTFYNGQKVIVSGGTLNVNGELRDNYANSALTISSGGTVNTGATGWIVQTPSVVFTSGTLNLTGTGAIASSFATGLTVGDSSGSTSAKALLNLSATATTSFSAPGLSIASNGEVTGTGKMTGTTTLSASTSEIAPGTIGAGTGTLTLAAVAAPLGGTLAFDLGPASTQLLSVTSLTVGTGQTLTFELNSIGSTPGVYTLATFTSDTGLTLAQLVNDPTDGVLGTFTLNASNIVFNETGLAVPEPSTWALFFASSVFLVGGTFLRRRNSDLGPVNAKGR